MSRWALVGLIAAIAMIIVFLFGFPLGFYSAGNFVQSNCIAQIGYACTSPMLHDGIITMKAGQLTSYSWTHANIFFANGTQTPNAVPPLPCEQGVDTLWSPGASVNVSLNSYDLSNVCIGFTTIPHQIFLGSIWVSYTAQTNSAPQLAEIGIITTQST